MNSTVGAVSDRPSLVSVYEYPGDKTGGQRPPLQFVHGCG
jgi:hypothetical protein